MNNTDNPQVLAVVPLPTAEERRRREVNGPNQMQWGSRLHMMSIFFDNVFQIPPSSQGWKFCIACGSQATYVKLDDDGEPLSYLCDEHVVGARR